MKALFYMGPGKLELRKVKEPSTEGNVVVKVLEAGICGTDIKTFLRGHHLFNPPAILGHECYGIVIKKPSFIKGMEIGDYVVIAPYGECGTCEKCRRGLPELCEKKTHITDGCFVQYLQIPVEHALKGLFKVENPGSHLILAEPLACVLGALRKLSKARSFLIIGGGVMGSLFGIYLKSKNMKVRIVELSEWRLSFLKRMGFDAIPPSSLTRERNFDAVIIASTMEDPFIYLDLIRDGGYLMLFGGYSKNERLILDPFHIHYREISVIGSFGYGLKDFAEAVEELRKEKEIFSRMITHSYRIDDYVKAFDKAISKECMKVSLRMWEDEKV